jgi:hypothetical protein
VIVICLATAILAFFRVKASRLLPLLSSLIVSLVFVYTLIKAISFGEQTDEETVENTVVGFILWLAIVLLPLLSTIAILCLGKRINKYFSGPTIGKQSHLPPPPPSF